MAHTYEELGKMTVAQLKEVAKETDHEAVKGYTQMNKDHLLKAVCTALNLDMHLHHEIKGVDKAAVKSAIRKLKTERDQAIESKDYKQLKAVRRQIKTLKNKLRRAMV